MLSRSPATASRRISFQVTCLVCGFLVTAGSATAQNKGTSTSQRDAKSKSAAAAQKSDTAQKPTKSAQGKTAQKSDADKKAQQAARPKKKPARLVSFSGGRTRLNVRHWPLIGDPDAKYVFVEMFDYTCPHCRNTHRALDGAFDRLGDDLAVVVLPVPLDRSCNSSVRSTGHAHREACAVAKIAVAVWRCNPRTFHKFHDWMFAVNRSRTAREARDYGNRLVGKEALDKEMAKPFASQYIKKHVELYQRAGAGTVPKLMFPRATLAGAITSPNTMVRTIERHLGPRR